MKRGTAPWEMTTWVCWDVPEAMSVVSVSRLVSALTYWSRPKQLRTVVSANSTMRTGLTWSIVLVLDKNSTNRGTTPHSITRSIGGFFSLDSSLLSVHEA